MKSLYGTPLKRFHRDFRCQHPVEHEVLVILQSVEYPMNVGSIFRIADVVEATELILTGITPTPPNPTIAKVGRQKHESVPWRYEKEAAGPIAQLKQWGYRVYALVLTADSRPYCELDWPERMGLVVGHEDHGIARATLSLCDEAVLSPCGARACHSTCTLLWR